MTRIVAIICLLFAIVSGSPVNKDPYDLELVKSNFSFPGLKVDVHWIGEGGFKLDAGYIYCYQPNAYYYNGNIYLCAQLKDTSPGVIRVVLAHELAHAVIHQFDIPYTGSSELAADELAAFVFSITGRQKDMYEYAKYVEKRNIKEDPWDPHPSDARRHAMYTCMAMGSQGMNLCTEQWRNMVIRWNKLLKIE